MKVSIEVSTGSELRDFMNVEMLGVGDPIAGAMSIPSRSPGHLIGSLIL